MIESRPVRVWTIWSALLLVWGGNAFATLVTCLVTRTPLPAILPSFVFRPLAFITVFTAVVLVFSVVTRQRLDQVWQRLATLVPFAFGVAAIVSLLKIWNDGSGSLALAPGDAGTFVLTAGILPLSLGPDVILRVSTIVFCVLSALLMMRRGIVPGRAFLAAVLAWIASAVILLAQSWMAAVAAFSRDLALQHSLDASRALGTVHANSYWSSFQADRFFAGIGNQLDINVLLSSTAFVFLLLTVLLVVAVWRSFRNGGKALLGLGKRLLGQPFLLLGSAALAGVIVGVRGLRINGNGPDIIAFGVALVVFLAWLAWWLFGRDMEDLSLDEREHPSRPLPSGIVSPDEVQFVRDASLALSFMGGFLLGWPVLFTVFALVSVSWMSSASGFGWATDPRRRIPAWTLLALGAGAFGGAVGVRAFILPPIVFGVAVAWGILAALSKGLEIVPQTPNRRFWLPGLILGASLLMAWALGSLIVLAAAALVILAAIALDRKDGIWLRYGFFLLLALGWIATALRYSLPA